MRETIRTRPVGGGAASSTIGCVLAAICSWTMHHSIVWAILHGFFGWFYLLYLCMGCGGGLPELR